MSCPQVFQLTIFVVANNNNFVAKELFEPLIYWRLSHALILGVLSCSVLDSHLVVLRKYMAMTMMAIMTIVICVGDEETLKTMKETSEWQTGNSQRPLASS